MKKRISIFVLSLVMGTTLLAQQNAASDKGCGSCNLVGTGISAFKYITDNQLHYKVADCVPFSDIEMYSSPSGGSVVAYATANEKGEADINLSDKVTVAFALNHYRRNEKGISGKGQIYNLVNNPVLDIESPVLKADNANSVTVSWKANSFGSNWQFEIQRSMNGKNFVTVSDINAGNSRSLVSYDIKNIVSEPGNGTVYYRIEARNSKTGVVIQTAIKDVTLPKSPLFTAINANSRIRVHFSDQVTYPAVYTFTEMQGTKIATGVLKTNDQVIDISSYQTKVYVLTIVDNKNNTGSQMLLKN
jgi:hypothetical protein